MYDKFVLSINSLSSYKELNIYLVKYCGEKKVSSNLQVIIINIRYNIINK